jgi:hypothetical protein
VRPRRSGYPRSPGPVRSTDGRPSPARRRAERRPAIGVRPAINSSPPPNLRKGGAAAKAPPRVRSVAACLFVSAWAKEGRSFGSPSENPKALSQPGRAGGAACVERGTPAVTVFSIRMSAPTANGVHIPWGPDVSPRRVRLGDGAGESPRGPP